MSSLTTFVDCPNLQLQLADLFCTGRPEATPIINFLFSAENNGRILEINALPGNGKKRTVQAVYQRRVLESEVDDYINYSCTASNKRGETSTTYELDINRGVEIAKRISILDLVERCESNESYKARFIMDLIDGARRKMETQAATKLATIAGTGVYSTIDLNPDGSAIASNRKAVKTLVSSSNPTQNYSALEAIMQTARLNNYCSAPIVIGEYEIANYFRRNTLAGCCSDLGMNIAEFINGSAPIVLTSYRMPSALGANTDFITLSAGAVLPMWFNLYEGDVNALNDDSNFAGTIIDPQTGIPFNLRVQRICDDWDFNLTLAWDLFSAPTDMFENSDVQDGNIFVHKYRVSNS